MLDEIIFETALVRVGRFRCATTDPSFRDSGPIQNHVVVFPRSAVWIRHAGSRWFAADAGIVTLYSAGQEYERAAISPRGDASDWFGLDPAAAEAALGAIGDGVVDPARPFDREYTTSDPWLYAQQRLLFRQIERGTIDPLDAEERVLELIARALLVRERTSGAATRQRSTQEARHDLVVRARAEVARDPSARTDVQTMARRLGTSPCHLCRVFRSETGQTLHGFRLDLRIRTALESLETFAPLTKMAIELGFHSHSHFSAVVRSQLGVTPTWLREYLSQ